MSNNILLAPLIVKAIVHVILSGSWVKSSLEKIPLLNHLPRYLTLETRLSCRPLRQHEIRIVLTDARIALLEVYVYGDGLHIVQRVLLVEGQTKIALIVHCWPLHVFSWLSWVVLAGTYLNVGIVVLKLRNWQELFLLREERTLHNVDIFLLEYGHF